MQDITVQTGLLYMTALYVLQCGVFYIYMTHVAAYPALKFYKNKFRIKTNAHQSGEKKWNQCCPDVYFQSLIHTGTEQARTYNKFKKPGHTFQDDIKGKKFVPESSYFLLYLTF